MGGVLARIPRERVRHARGRAPGRRRLAGRDARDRARARRARAFASGRARARRRPSHRASRPRATRATPPRSTSTATASTTRPSCERVLEPIARGRADYVLGSRFLGDRDGMSWHRNARQPPDQRAARHAHGHRHERRADRLPRLLGTRARGRPDRARLQLRPGAHALALGPRHRAGGGPDPLPPPHERPLLRPLPGVPRAGGAGGLAPSGAPRGPRAGRGPPRPPRSRPPASTPSRRPARTAAADP